MVESVSPPDRVLLSDSTGNPKFLFDVGTRLRYDWSGTVPLSPIETGARIADHVVVNPLRFDLEGWIVLEDPTEPTSTGPQDLEILRQRPAKVLEDLRLLLYSEALTITTQSRSEPNMALIRLSAEPEGEGIRISCGFQQLTYAETQTREVPPVPKSSARAATKGRADQGTTQGANQDTGDAQDGVRGSVASGLVDSLNESMTTLVRLLGAQ